MELEGATRIGDYPSVAKILTMALVAALATALAGCSAFDRESETPQQKFIGALIHSNAAQANQVWLQMSPEERLKFERGQGMRPEVSQQQVQQQIIRHAEERAPDEGAGAQQSALPAPEAGLSSLPGYAGQQQPPPAAPQ